MTDTLELSHWIGGEKVAGDRPGESHNPSDTRDIVARTPKGGAAEVDQAVAAATDAFEGWSEASPEVRFDVLDKAGSLIMERREQIGRLLSREEGKTLAEGVGETARAARILKFFAGEALRLHGQNLASTRPGVEVQTYRQAVGVFGLIPMLGVLAILGLYSFYLLFVGLPILMKTPEDKKVGYFVVTVVLGIVVYFIISAIIGSISMMFIASTAAMSGLAGL